MSRVGGRQGEGYIAPDVQREAINGYARELGGTIVGWHQDENITGGTTERPDFQAALDLLRGGEADGLVVMATDRFARSVVDRAAIVREIIDRGQVFASCQERIDPRTEMGQYLLNLFLNNAELFLNQKKAGWRIAKAKAVARGVHIGPTPIGYSRIPKGEPRSGVLVPHPTYGPAMTELFERAANGNCSGRDSTTGCAGAAEDDIPSEESFALDSASRRVRRNHHPALARSQRQPGSRRGGAQVMRGGSRFEAIDGNPPGCGVRIHGSWSKNRSDGRPTTQEATRRVALPCCWARHQRRDDPARHLPLVGGQTRSVREQSPW